jgi:hypothetical protein
MLSLAHGAVALALAGHLSAKGKGAADPEMLIDDLFSFLRPTHVEQSLHLLEVAGGGLR